MISNLTGNWIVKPTICILKFPNCLFTSHALHKYNFCAWVEGVKILEGFLIREFKSVCKFGIVEPICLTKLVWISGKRHSFLQMPEIIMTLNLKLISWVVFFGDPTWTNHPIEDISNCFLVKRQYLQSLTDFFTFTSLGKTTGLPFYIFWHNS